MNQRMSREESLALFEKFTGSMKVPADFDEKKELFESLDERYGVRINSSLIPTLF